MPTTNSTDETEKSVTPISTNHAELIAQLIQTTESAVAKQDDQFILTTASTSSNAVPDALGKIYS